jgi:hypothetical protein
LFRVARTGWEEIFGIVFALSKKGSEVGEITRLRQGKNMHMDQKHIYMNEKKKGDGPDFSLHAQK